MSLFPPRFSPRFSPVVTPAAWLRRSRPVRLLVPLAQGKFAAAVMLLAVLHLDRRWGPISPVTAMLSDYALTPGWWMWAAALTLTSTGSVWLLLALWRHGVAGRAVTAGLVLWCASLLAVAVFTKDPQGGAVSPTGKIHLYASAISCLSLPLVGWALGRKHRDDPRWRTFATWTRRLGLASIPFYLPFIVPFAAHVVFGLNLPTVATGLVERLMMAVEMALLAVLALWARRTVPIHRADASTCTG